jgi:6-pyruvoyltetrahydropterin/6-carboxytetrahydropterin synthase
MSYTLTKKFKFEASHYLPHHDGKCARLHGHSWNGELIVRGEKVQTEGAKQGMVIDYGDIKKVLNPLIEEKLDHYHLNDSLPSIESPTSENIAKFIYEYIKPNLPELIAVRIEETCTSSCTYSGSC